MGDLKAATQHLAGLRLRAALARAKQEHRLLKEGLHAEVDALLSSGKVQALQAELKQLQEGEARTAAKLCYGLPPEWRPAGSVSSAGSGEWSGHWQEGTEVGYSARLLLAPIGAQKLQLVHTQQSVRLQLYGRPFAHGGLRECFYARDENNGCFVLKRNLVESSKLRKRVAALHADAEATAYSQAAAQAFCAKLGVPGAIEYLPATIVVLEAAPGSPGEKAVYLKEPWLDTSGARWEKYTRNDGHIFPEGEAAGTIQAFTHFSLAFLRPRLGCDAMVLDAQGIQRSAGGLTKFTLTDPAICTADSRYGRADLGAPAIAAFLKAHTCGVGCHSSGCAGVRSSAAAPA